MGSHGRVNSVIQTYTRSHLPTFPSRTLSSILRSKVDLSPVCFGSLQKAIRGVSHSLLPRISWRLVSSQKTSSAYTLIAPFNQLQPRVGVSASSKLVELWKV